MEIRKSKKEAVEKDFGGFCSNHLADNPECGAIVDETIYVCSVFGGLGGTVNVASGSKEFQIR